MPDLRASIDDLSDIAQAAARAFDESAALDTVINDVSRALDTRACIFQRVDRGWMLVAQARGGLRLPTADLQAALDSLPPEFRAAVVLCDIEGLSYEEIGATLGVKLGTVRSRIHRGRQGIRDYLAAHSQDPEYSANSV